MAKYRMATVLSETSNLAAGTKVIDILEQDPISRLDIYLRLTGDGSATNTHPAAAITKIELVDGSDVLFSMNGKQARAMAILGTGKVPGDMNVYLNDVQCHCMIHIPFGRYLFDDNYALVPMRFKNLQLKITHDRALGGNHSDILTLAIYAQIFDEKKVSPASFLMTKKVYDYIGSPTGWEYIDLPTDLPFRQIVIQAEYSGANPNSVYNKIKLSEDNDKKVPINEMSVSSYMKLIADRYNPITESLFVGGDAGSRADPCMCNYNLTINGASAESGTSTYSSYYTAAGGTFYHYDSSVVNQNIEITGWIPHGALPLIIVGDLNDPSDWYDVSRIGNLQLQIYGGSEADDATTAVLIQQVRPN